MCQQETEVVKSFTFLADRASFLAGGGDMALVASDEMLLRAGGFSFAVFCSSVLWERSTLLAGDARLPEPFRGVEGVSPTGALLGLTMESWQQNKTAMIAHFIPHNHRLQKKAKRY